MKKRDGTFYITVRSKDDEADVGKDSFMEGQDGDLDGDLDGDGKVGTNVRNVKGNGERTAIEIGRKNYKRNGGKTD